MVVDSIRCEDISGVDHVLRLANRVFDRSNMYMSNPMPKNGSRMICIRYKFP